MNNFYYFKELMLEITKTFTEKELNEQLSQMCCEARRKEGLTVDFKIEDDDSLNSKENYKAKIRKITPGEKSTSKRGSKRKADVINDNQSNTALNSRAPNYNSATIPEINTTNDSFSNLALPNNHVNGADHANNTEDEATMDELQNLIGLPPLDILSKSYANDAFENIV